MRASEDVVVGIDIGTTSAKAVAFTVDGVARAASGNVGYPLHSPAPGREEQDAGAVLDAALAATRECVAAALDAGCHIAGLSLSSAMHSLIGLDAGGEPVTPLVTWADARASELASSLRASDAGLALHRRTGTPIHPMSPLLKLRWFADCAPEVAARVAHWVGVKELVLLRLTGELVMDHGIASGSGLFDLRASDWDGEALEYARVDAGRLPRLVPTTEVLRLGAAGAAAVGLPEGTPVVAGSGDGPLANLGLGAIRPGMVACSIGTSGALRVAADRPLVDPRGRVFCYVLAPGRYTVGGAVNNGGIVLEWLGQTVAPDIGPEDLDALLALAEEAPAGSDGLLFLPYLLGERAPHWRAGARGVWLGLTREHQRKHLLRSAIEGVCLQLALVLHAMEEAGARVDDIRATGGFSRSALWRQMLASAFGRPIGFAASREGSSLGAALLGMTALGMIDSLDRAAELVAVADTQEPDAAEADLYARLLPVFDATSEAASAQFDALAAVMSEPRVGDAERA